MWCFQNIRFVPQNFDGLVQVILEVNLCQDPDDSLSVWSMRRIPYACVSLGVESSESTLQKLVDQVLCHLHVSTSHLCHVAWSLAALHQSTTTHFESILRKLCSEAVFGVDQSGFQKLCQAFNTLQPLDSHATDLQSAWTRLCERVQALELPAIDYYSPAGSLVQLALRHLMLVFEQDTTLGDYQPDAVLLQISGSPEVVMVATNPEDYAISDPDRWAFD